MRFNIVLLNQENLSRPTLNLTNRSEQINFLIPHPLKAGLKNKLGANDHSTLNSISNRFVFHVIKYGFNITRYSQLKQ